ncbi:anti-sigma factor [Tersicoccus sp. Bi-70]|uniref:anti-sigma factor n=1 Tax=Tersicoccus sp. Bi-70 TaxID=1897634 RepID=UPI000977FA08|nr:anti-sigma factor [Tersicoccus sp. Bi-70]OMH34318.1 hypothetical protein BGP79_04195 [Tersicoccus sp. Bi-70]
MSDQHDDETDFSDVETELGLALPVITPRAEVKARLMAAIADLPQLPAGDGALTAAEDGPRHAATDDDWVSDDRTTGRPAFTAVTGERATAADARKASATTDGDRTVARGTGDGDNVVQLNRWRRTAAWLGAAAAVLLVAAVALGGWAGNLNQQRVEAQQRLDSQNAGREAALAVFAAPDAVVRAGNAGNGGSMSVASSKSLNRSAVISRDLPALESGKTYELWYIAGQQARPAGTFTGSSGVSYTALEGQLDGATHVGVTVEPAGGSKAPTTTPIVVQPTEA